MAFLKALFCRRSSANFNSGLAPFLVGRFNILSTENRKTQDGSANTVVPEIQVGEGLESGLSSIGVTYLTW